MLASLLLQQAAKEALAGLTAMGIVISRHDARGNLDGLELLLGGADYRKIGALEKIVAPVGHDGDETLGLHLHQRVAILRPGFDALLPMFHFTHRSHAVLLCRGDVLAIVFSRQPLTRKTTPGDPPQQ